VPYGSTYRTVGHSEANDNAKSNNQIMKMYKFKTAATIWCLIFSVFPLFAGPGNPNDPYAGDDPSATIAAWEFVLPVAALFLALYFKKQLPAAFHKKCPDS
jgi:hypothetical protein